VIQQHPDHAARAAFTQVARQQAAGGAAGRLRAPGP
jgi:hypothetical protein